MVRTTETKKRDPRGIIGQISAIREAANALIEAELLKRGLHGIVPAHGTVLSFLFAQTEPIPIKALVQHAGRVKSTVTGIVSTLERHGYLTRQVCSHDARSVRVALTEKGQALKQDFQEISAILYQTVYKDFTPEEIDTLATLLGKIESNIQR